MKKNQGRLTNISLRKKSIAIFFLLVTLPSLLVGYAFLNRYDTILRQQFIDSTEKNLNTIEMNLYEKIKTVDDMTDYMIYQKDFRNFMQTAETPETLDQLNKDRESIEGFVAFQLMSKSYIKSITLQGLKGNTMQLGEPVDGPEQPWIDLAKENRGRIVWSNSYPLTSAWTGPKRVVSLFRIINSFDDLTKTVGLVIVRLNESEISKLLTAAIPKEQGSIFILRPDGTVLLDSNKELIGQPYPNSELLNAVNQSSSQVTKIEINGKNHVVFNKFMRSTGWNIVTLVSDETIVAKTSALKVSLQALFLVVFIFGLFALIGFELAIIRPMLELKKQTSRLKTGDFSARVTVRSRDEIGELGRQFNNMVQTIKELIDKKYKLEIQQKESELRILQSQMDPHFLYNTLDMIRWTARLEKAPETSQLIEALSGFFRMSMNREKRTATLADELEFVRSYLNLQQKRMGSKLAFSLLMEASLEEVVLPRRLIQPLVENSIKHSFISRQKGEIRVRCYRSLQDELIIDVADTGMGFTKERLQAIRQALAEKSSDESLVGHALCNIHELISLVYGGGYGVEIPEEYNQTGACVRLRIPIQTNGQEAI
ncbi:sensor histidine kinase [Paenibacillus radicis (ex Xue et al. 2023)]|uniref:Histidine kinase n=1 Tax=Paenibacillus radicis (ex Xue et al. 2023) TaxID=2972489 RepID=A0ABT1YPR5_9BACL|nr:sensor histidine kinase [Paenibacillus radicis (ex Xue et al. 2023)]MCR8634349.1 histidine kinase [Paenibacillus radicis (ex Xue et al. 2023)]